MAFKLGLGREFEVLDISGDDLSVGDEKAVTVDHVRDHHDLVSGHIGELERELGRLNVVGEDDEVGGVQDVGAFDDVGDAARDRDRVPEADEDLAVDGDPDVVRNVVLAKKERAET